MNKRLNAIIILLLMSGLCGATMAAETILANESFTLNKEVGIVTAEKFISDDEVGVIIKNAAGQKLLEIHNIGTQDKQFLADEKSVSLLAKDLTGDKMPEVIAAAYYGPASALYVFSYQADKKAFIPMKFIDSKDASLQRNYMVSDLPMENGRDMRIEANNNLLAVGKIYPSASGQKPMVGEYKFAYENGAFKLISTTPVVDKE